MRQLTISLGLMAFLGGPVSAQAVKDPAELVPARTLLFVELRQPGAVLKELAELLKGSYLEDVPDSLAPLKAKLPLVERGTHVEMMFGGILFAPEVIQELSRVKGVALAVTGMSKEDRGMPEFVVILQPGDSHVVSFLMRMAMVGFASGGKARFGDGVVTEWRGGLERVGDFEGVGLYRHVNRRIEFKNGKVVGKPEVTIAGPAVARLPDTILVGSPAQVKETILRMKGKSDGPSLAGVKAFQKARKDFEAKPGVVAFANPAAVIDLLEKNDLFDLGRDGADILKVVKSVVNPKAFEAVADQLTLENATLAYRRRVYLNPEEKSPLLEALPSKGVPTHLLHFAPADALGFVALSNDGGEKRLKHALNLADGVANALGADEVLPSQMLAKIEEAIGLEIGKDIAGNIKCAALALASLERIVKANFEPDQGGHILGKATVTVLVDAVDAQAAVFLAKKGLPKVIASLARERAIEPTEEKVDGHRLWSLRTKNGPVVHYGLEGTTIAIGFSQKSVAESLTSGQKKKGLLADEKISKRIKDLDGPFAVAMMRPMALVGMTLVIYSDHAPEGKIEKRDARREEGPPKSMQLLMDVLKTEQPALLSLTRTKDQLTAALTFPGLHPLVGRLVNLMLEEWLRPNDGRNQPAADDATEKKQP